MIYPKQIIIESSAVCNLRCKGCPINTNSNRGGLMEWSYFKSIIDRIDFPVVVIPWANGEPLMHPQIAQMVEYINAAGHKQYLTTNGHFWNESLFQRITDPDSTCYQIIFSLDGLDDSVSIVKARPGSDPEKVLSTINDFLDLKRKKGAKLDVAVKIVRRGQDWQEIEEYILQWLDRGVDYVCEGRMLEEDTVDRMRRYPCQYFDNNFMVIRWDGRLVLCAYNDKVVNNGENPLFALDEMTPLLEAYNSEAYQRYREHQNQGCYDGPCATCGFAYTGMGMDGWVRFRKDPKRKISYRRDYYNSFYSLQDRGKVAAYYKPGGGVIDAGDFYIPPERKA